MKKVINLVLAVLTVGTLNAQWSYKTVKNGFDNPYKLAYTPENNGASAYMLVIDSAVILEISGGYYCDEEPNLDVVLVVNGVDKKFEFEGYKGSTSDVIYITWDMELHPEFLDAFKLASTMRIRVNESYCTTEIYTYKMTNSKAAFDYIRKQ
jgi:hypothetical protein